MNPVFSRYRIPHTKWTLHRGAEGIVVLEEWSDINGTHVGVIRTLFIKDADWVDAVVHVSAFGELSTAERNAARSAVHNIHRGTGGTDG